MVDLEEVDLEKQVEERMKSQPVKVLKLKTGEELISRIGDDSLNNQHVMDQPMVITVVMQNNQPALTMTPWIMSSSDTIFKINSDEILTKAKARGDMEKQYLSLITGLSL